jgi:hypothetical protein
VVVRRRTTQFFELRQVLLEIVGHAIGELHLIDRAIRAALTAGAVVRDDHDQGVLQLVVLLQEVEQPAHVMVRVREESGVHLGHPAEEAPLVVVQRVPRPGEVQLRERQIVRAATRLGCSDRVKRRQFDLGRHQTQLLLPSQGLLPHCLITHIEAAGELLDPLFRGMVRRVAGSGCVVKEERLLGGDRLSVFEELDGLVGEVIGEVVTLLRRTRWLDGVVVVYQVGIPLVRLRAEEPIPALEASAARPVAARRRQVHLIRWAQVPLADHVGVPAELSEDFREHPVLRRDGAARVREPDRGLGDAGHAVPGVIATVEQARARRRAQRCGVPLGEPHPVCRDPVDVRGLDWTPVAAHRGKADVVEHHVQNIRCPVRRPRRLERSPVRF